MTHRDEAGFDNPALADLGFLVGEWAVTVSDASFLNDGQTLDGTMVGSWLEGRALLMLRSRMPGGPPASVQVIGRNEALPGYEVLYADDRGVSRVYASMFDGAVWTLRREDSGFHQRFEGRVSADRRRIDAAWWRSEDDGRTWLHDFAIVYVRRD